MRGVLVALDLETTGLDVQQDSIIEIGAVRLQDGQIIDEFSTLVNPGFDIPPETTHITGIFQENLRGAPILEAVLTQIDAFVGNAPIVAHNADFDVSFMRRFGLFHNNLPVDTFELSSILYPQMPRYNLTSLTETLGIELEHAHRALDDARATALLYWKVWQRALSIPSTILNEIINAARPLDWPLISFFEAAVQEKLARGDEQETITDPLDLFTPPAEDSQPLQANEQIDLLSVDEILAIIDENGALSQHIPHYEKRDEQMEMTRTIVHAFNKHRHIMIEAGTGTGKSIAYLVPAAAWAATNNARVVISTNTINLQDQLIKKDVPLLQQVMPTPFNAAIMKGRSNYLCPRRLAAVRRRYPSNEDELRTMAKILVWMLDSQTGDRGEISLRAGEHFVWQRLSAQDEGCTMHRCRTVMQGKCPFYKARKAAEAAHVVIVNHALLISDALTENRVLPEYHYLVVDEAHQLEDAVTNGMSVRVDQLTLLRRLNELGGISSGVLGDLLTSARDQVPDKMVMKLEAFIQSVGEAVQAMSSYIRRFFKAVFTFINEGEFDNYQIRITERERATPHFAHVRRAWKTLDEFFQVVSESLNDLASAVQTLEKYEIPGFDDHVNSAAAAGAYLNEMHYILTQFVLQPDPNTIYWVNKRDEADYISIQTAPLHVGPMVEQHIWQSKEAAVLTSATLRTAGRFKYIRDRLYADDIEAHTVGSPFDYQASTLVFIPDDIPMPNRNGYQQAVERGIIDLATALDGRVMALFTSYSQLRETASAIAPRLALGKITVYDQATGGSRESLLDSFKSADKAVLLGTRSFWEGVDIPGTDLSALVIVRLPFAVPSDPVFASRAETYDNHFAQYAIPDAILRFRQGFGRLIRTRSDRGIVTIFDSRVINKNYGLSFLESLPDCTIEYGKLDHLASAAKKWLQRD